MRFSRLDSLAMLLRVRAICSALTGVAVLKIAAYNGSAIVASTHFKVDDFILVIYKYGNNVYEAILVLVFSRIS